VKLPVDDDGAGVKSKTIAARIEVPGAKPASFKLVERATESFDLFRSSRKIGTARVEERGKWTADFEASPKRWKATAGSAEALLRLIGTFLLAGEARAAAARPVEEIDPGLRIKGRMNAEQKLSREFASRAQRRRLAELDVLIAECRKNIRPA
jgi:hypothetical protein